MIMIEAQSRANSCCNNYPLGYQNLLADQKMMSIVIQLKFKYYYQPLVISVVVIASSSVLTLD